MTLSMHTLQKVSIRVHNVITSTWLYLGNAKDDTGEDELPESRESLSSLGLPDYWSLVLIWCHLECHPDIAHINGCCCDIVYSLALGDVCMRRQSSTSQMYTQR